MQAKGIIFTAIDTDADNIEAWNRWYDVEHLPPNIALPEIAHGRRYVAPPALHEVRLPAEPARGFADGQGVHVTIYLTVTDPTVAIASMTEEREVLLAAGRMDNAGNRAVRTGDAMDLLWAAARPELRLAEADVPFLAHRSLRVVLRSECAEVRAVTDAALTVPGVLGVCSFASRFFAGTFADFYLIEAEAAETTLAARTAAAYPDDVEVTLDAPFEAITAFDYAFADDIRASTLPQVLDTDQVL